MAELSIT